MLTLPRPLVPMRRSNGKIQLIFARPTPDNIALVQSLQAAVSSLEGHSRKEVQKELSRLEGLAQNYKFSRGVSELLLRQCDFALRDGLRTNPATARRLVFQLANPIPVSGSEREKVLQQSSERLGISISELEEALWADEEGELVLRKYRPVAATSLLTIYNLELIESLIFRSSTVSVRNLANWRKITWFAKRARLMYDAAQVGGEVWIKFYGLGEGSKSSRKYGEALVQLFREVANQKNWKLEARIESGSRGYYNTFELNSNEARLLGINPSVSEDTSGGPSFDSKVEKRFYYAFKSLPTGWKIGREDSAVSAGGSLFLPDFTLRKGGVTVYVEIVGFWTKEYIEKKVRKLVTASSQHIIVAADVKLACSSLTKVPGIIYFEKDVPLAPVIEYLKSVERGAANSDYDKDPVPPDSDKSGVKEGTPPEASPRKLTPRRASQDELDTISRILNAPEPKLETINEFCLSRGLDSTEVVKQLGFRLKWNGLDSSSVTFERANQQVAMENERE